MPPPSRRFTVHRADLDKGAKIEAQEHPGFSKRSHRRIARQHLEKYGPGYYRTHDMQERMTDQVNKRMHAKPIKRRRPEPDGPFVDPMLRRLGLL